MADNLGQLVRAKRQSEGMGLREAAKQSGVAFATIGRVENGGEPSLRVDRALRAWLNGETPGLLLPMPPMTVRDWFAGQALAGIMAFPGELLSGRKDYTAEEIADCSYAIADAMLAARDQSS